MIKRIKTGIPGMDELLKGGLREKTSILIGGPPGTGKTIFAIQFIIEGAKRKEPGIYITSEETVEDIRECADSLGLPLRKYEKKGLITLIQQSILPKKLMTISVPLNQIKKKKVKRVVLDSITLFEYGQTSGIVDYRKEVLNFVLRMKELDVNLLAIAEKPVIDIDNIQYKPEDFLFEGVIILTKIRQSSSFEHCIKIPKIRGQDHSVDVHPYKISKGGITIFPTEIPFLLIGKDAEKGK